MVDYAINVKVDPSGASAGLAEIGRGMTTLEASANRLRSVVNQALTFVGLGLGVKTLTDLADAYTQATNRIKTVTSSNAELAVVMDKVFQIARSTGVELSTVVNVYQRTAAAAKNLGLSQQDFLDFTRGLTESVVISGSASQQARAGLLQIAQGMGQATLNGRELRAIIHDLPGVAQLLADEMNRLNPGLHATTGNLRELSQAGKLVPKTLIDAVLNSMTQLDAQFAHVAPTIARATQTLHTALIQFIGDLNNSSGIQGTFAKAILFIADNLQTIARYAALAGGIIAVNFAVNGIVYATKAMLAFGRALISSPFSAFLGTLGLAVGLVIGFGDQIQIAAGHTANLQDFFVVAFSNIGSSFLNFIGHAKNGWGAWAESAESANSEIRYSFIDLVRDIAASIDGVMIELITAEVTLARVYQNVRHPFSTQVNPAQGAFDLAKDIYEPHSLTGSLDSTVEEADKRAQERIAKQKKSQTEYDDALKHLTDRNPAIAGPAGKLDTYDNIVTDLQQKLAAYKLINEEDEKVALEEEKIRNRLKVKALTPGQIATVDPLIRKGFEQQEENKLYQSIQGPSDKLIRGTGELNDLFGKGAINIDQYNEELRKLQAAALATDTSLSGGLKSGLVEIGKEFDNVANLAKNVLVDAFKNAEGAIVAFAQTGKFNIKTMVDGILTDLIRLEVRQNITAPIAQALGSLTGAKEGGAATGGGGILGAAFSFIGSHLFAQGDVFDSPTAFGFGSGQQGILGEAGPEGVLPLKRNSSGALGVIASGAGGQHVFAPTVSVSVTGATGDTQQNTSLANMMAGKVQDKLNATMGDYIRKQSRVGGLITGRNELK